jgi:hypothetical protein
MTEPAPAPCPRAGCGCPACAVAAALTLLATGRAGMARTVLAPVPGLIRRDRAADRARAERVTAEVRSLGARVDELARARGLDRVSGLAGARRKPVPRKKTPPPARATPAPPPQLPRKPRPSELLDAALVAGRTTPERVAEVLGCRPGDVAAIAAGRVALAPGA